MGVGERQRDNVEKMQVERRKEHLLPFNNDEKLPTVDGVAW